MVDTTAHGGAKEGMDSNANIALGPYSIVRFPQ